MIFGADRRADRPVRHLEWRVRLVGVGAILAVFGVAGDVEVLRWGALAVLVAAAAVGLYARRTPPRDGGSEKNASEDETV